MIERCLNLPPETEALNTLADFIARLQIETHNPILIELAVNELFVNSIRHGCASRCTVTYQKDDAGWRLIVSDDGQAFNPLEGDLKPLGELRNGGYGLHLIRSIARHGEISHRREHGWNHTELRFALETDPPSERITDPTTMCDGNDRHTP